MSDALRQQVSALLETIAIPHVAGFTCADMAEMAVEGDKVLVRISLGFPCEGIKQALASNVETTLASNGIQVGGVEVVQDIPAIVPKNTSSSIGGVKNIIAVGSGKGGVGKSTTSVNIALALAHMGAKVGLLDADIYGPSQHQMLGVAGKRPEMYGPNMIEPIKVHGLSLISMGNLVTEDTPMIWRGPMVSGALQQLLQNTHWVDIDYLIIDMPPGTGDIQLTLSQAVPVSGSVIVTTPQDIALLDAVKGIEMFRKVNIPVLGVVENMSVHTCSNCGHKEAIFGEEGGNKLAKQYDVNVLGRLPLQLDIREQTDQGKPPVATNPESDVSLIYRDIATQMTVNLWRQGLAAPAAPEISFSDD